MVQGVMLGPGIADNGEATKKVGLEDMVTAYVSMTRLRRKENVFCDAILLSTAL